MTSTIASTLRLAFTDLDKMAGNFGFSKGVLKPDAIAKVKIANSNFAQFMLARGKHIFLAAAYGALERVPKTKSLAGELTAEQRRTFGSADVLFHINPKAQADDWTAMTKALAEEFGKTADLQEKESMAQFVKSLESLRLAALGGLRRGQGAGHQLLDGVSQGKRHAGAGSFLAEPTFPRATPTSKGLPQGNVLAAQAYAGDSAKNAVLARAFVNFLLEHVLETKQITSATDRPAFVGVFNEVWQRLSGSRLAVYLTPPEAQRGMFSAVAVLDTDDAKKFVSRPTALCQDRRWHARSEAKNACPRDRLRAVDQRLVRSEVSIARVGDAAFAAHRRTGA